MLQHLKHPLTSQGHPLGRTRLVPDTVPPPSPILLAALAYNRASPFRRVGPATQRQAPIRSFPVHLLRRLFSRARIRHIQYR